jgi:hypothetical protein
MPDLEVCASDRKAARRVLYSLGGPLDHAGARRTRKHDALKLRRRDRVSAPATWHRCKATGGAEMRRKRQGEDPEGNTHYGKAFKASCKLLEAEARLASELSSATRARLTKTVRDKSAELEELTERDRTMNRLLAQYLPERGGKLMSYRDFIEWCESTRDRLDEREQRGQLNKAERSDLAVLNKLTELDPRTIQYRFQIQYRARGKSGRPRKEQKDQMVR